MDRQAHWQQVFLNKDTSKVSWYQEKPETCLSLIHKYSKPTDALIEIGGGDSRLPDFLLKGDYRDVTVLDVSKAALDASKARLESEAQCINWLVKDVLDLNESKSFQLWHDRAVFHFLKNETEQLAYKQSLLNHLKQDGIAIIGAFSANNGPEKCSGLDVQQHNKNSILNLFGSEMHLLEDFEEIHTTPSGVEQNFYWAVLKRI